MRMSKNNDTILLRGLFSSSFFFRTFLPYFSVFYTTFFCGLVILIDGNIYMTLSPIDETETISC